MDIQEFNRRILQKQEQLKDLVRRKMPVIVGNIAKRHIEEDFRKGGFTHNGFHKWQETERQRNGGKGADSRYGPLLSGRNHLSGSIEYTPGNGTVTVFTRVSYAGIHTQGGMVQTTVTPKMRRFAWAMYYKATGIKRKMKHGGKARKQREENASKEALNWKRLALTKKTKLTVHIPRRQFMPSTPGTELTKKISDKLQQEIQKIINI